MSSIHILPDHLVSQIAAGEVVERPASVVKELLENALDAGASSLSIEVVHGGKRSIRVTDDGLGMDRDDALLAFDRHATSKIESFEDLESVSTLGFRGEALASIAAVSRVDLLTATAPGEGFRVLINGGRVRRAEPSAAPVGTSIEVASLFFNVPARRKFLKTPRTELRRTGEVVQAYALARPDVALSMRQEGRVVLEAPAGDPGREGLRRRVEYVFGGELAETLVDIDRGDGAAASVWGLIGNPETTRGRRSFVFVNRRLVRDRAVMATFYRAVRDEWRSDEFPALFLFLDLPGTEVDVNVHPQKAEVRFRDSGFLDLVYRTLREALSQARGTVPTLASIATTLPPQPFSWEAGSEAASEPRGGWHRAQTVAEALRPFPDRLAEISYSPLEARVVPLSRRGETPQSFRILGQYKGALLLLEGPDGLYLIDQHVAHERVLYERIRANLESDQPQSQALLEPLLLELSAAEKLELEGMMKGLEACGFELSSLSGKSVAVAAIPAAMGVEQARATLQSLAHGNTREGRTAASLRQALIEETAASLACRAAVKMHEPLGVEEMQDLLSELFATEQPFACPHGRPIVLKLSDFDLEKRFKRR